MIKICNIAGIKYIIKLLVSVTLFTAHGIVRMQQFIHAAIQFSKVKRPTPGGAVLVIGLLSFC